jgi:hypothetical protein
MFHINEVVSDYYDTYKNQVLDRIYHPLKTFDSVARFKLPIIRILNHWLRDDQIRNKLVAQARVYSTEKDVYALESDIIMKINVICDMFETLDLMINEIDVANGDYTKASTNKVLYINNNDKSIRGQLETIFKAYTKAVNGIGNLPKILAKMQDSIFLFDQGYISDDSITMPINRLPKMISSPMPIFETGDTFDEDLMRQYLATTARVFTEAEIYEFMKIAFGNDDEVESINIPLPSYDAFLLLILAVLKHSDNGCFYTIAEIENVAQVSSYGYSLPNFKFRKKEYE